MVKWTEEEDNALLSLIQKYGEQWSLFEGKLGDRTKEQIESHYKKVLLPKTCNLKKGRFTDEDDKKIMEWVKENGARDWKGIAEILNTFGKRVREHYYEKLDPNRKDIKTYPLTSEEEEKIIELVKKKGKKWKEISKDLPGRSPNDIKNKWNSSLKKKVEKKESANIIRPKIALPPKQAPVVKIISCSGTFDQSNQSRDESLR